MPLKALRQTLSGSLSNFFSEAMMAPAGLIIAIYLSRRLDPHDFGTFILLSAIIGWIELSLYSVYSRSSIAILGLSSDSNTAASQVMKLHLITGAAATAVVAGGAPWIARLLREPELTDYLKLYALEIFLYTLSSGFKSILVSTGAYHRRAAIIAVKWTFRVLLTILFVSRGWAVAGAVMGSVGAVFCEVVLCLFVVRIRWKRGFAFTAAQFFQYSAPLAVFALAMRLFDKMDLFLLKGFGLSATGAGIYGAAQNLALLPALFAYSVSPLLLAEVQRQLKEGSREGARQLSREAIRFGWLLLPVIGIISGSSSEIVTLVYGTPYSNAAPLLSILVVGAFAMFFLGILSGIWTALGKPIVPAKIGLMLLPLGLLLDLFVIPRWKSTGAATVTCFTSIVGAFAAYRMLSGFWPVKIHQRSGLVSVLLFAGSFLICWIWKTPGVFVIFKMAALALINAAAYFVLKEFRFRNDTSAANLNVEISG